MSNELTPDEAAVLGRVEKVGGRAFPQKIIVGFDLDWTALKIMLIVSALVTKGFLAEIRANSWNGDTEYKSTEAGRAALAAFKAKT